MGTTSLQRCRFQFEVQNQRHHLSAAFPCHQKALMPLQIFIFFFSYLNFRIPYLGGPNWIIYYEIYCIQLRFASRNNFQFLLHYHAFVVYSFVVNSYIPTNFVLLLCLNACLQEPGVELRHLSVEPIQTEYTKVVYLVRSQLNLMKLISSHIKYDISKGLQREYFVYFVPRRTVVCEKVRFFPYLTRHHIINYALLACICHSVNFEFCISFTVLLIKFHGFWIYGMYSRQDCTI